MCEARVMVKKGDQERIVMDGASAVVEKDGLLVVRNILGDRVEIAGSVERVDLLSNVIVIRER